MEAGSEALMDRQSKTALPGPSGGTESFRELCQGFVTQRSLHSFLPTSHVLPLLCPLTYLYHCLTVRVTQPQVVQRGDVAGRTELWCR